MPKERSGVADRAMTPKATPTSNPPIMPWKNRTPIRSSGALIKVETRSMATSASSTATAVGRQAVGGR